LIGWGHQCVLGQAVYVMVRFEDVILHTDEVLRNLSQFLRLDPPLTQAMLDRAAESSRSSLASPWTSFDDRGKGLLTAPVGRYKKRLSADELGMIEFLTRRCLVTCGYTLAGGRMPTHDLLLRMVRHPTSVQRYIRNRWKHRWLSLRCKSGQPMSISDD
jgi:hypothetical protein